MKKIIPFLLLISITHVGYAQFEILPKIAASPEVAMLDKFQSINISTYTGVPNVSIPLYSIKVDGVELPIVLSYNSSGIHVAEEATWVGLGWNLSVGGNITQTPIGTPDQDDALFKDTTEYKRLIGNVTSGYNSYSSRPEKGLVWAECVPWVEGNDSYNVFHEVNSYQCGRPDNYSYAIPGGSGKFYIDPMTKLPVIYGSKKEHVFIAKTTSQAGTQWTIGDLNGVQNVFYQKDFEYSKIFPTPYPNAGESGSWGSATWWLSNMLLPSGKQINFTYSDDNSYTRSQSQTYNRSNLLDRPANDLQTLNYLSQVTNYSKKLTLIDTDKEQIEFELSTTKNERADLKEGTTNGIPKRLNAIHIWDKILQKKIKTFKFNYDYFKGSCPNGVISNDCARLKLNSIQEIGYTSSGTEDTSKPPYQFQYDETNPLPSKQSYAVDFWGYYNGRNSNTGLLPKLPEAVLMSLIESNNFPLKVVQDFYDKGNANRGMDPVYATSGLVNKITYPTGGYLQLKYEANNFSNYPIVSAADLDNAQGVNLYKTIDSHDFRTCGDTLPKQSEIFYPRNNGELNLLNFHINFQIILQSDPKYNFAYEYNKYGKAYVSLCRIDVTGNTTVVETWNILTGSAFSQSNPYDLIISKISYKFNSTDKYYFECSLGADVPCHNGMPGNGCVSVSCSVFDPNVKLPVYKSIGGGVRIASQETYNSDGTLATKRNYNYVNADGNTSGKLMSYLRFYSFRTVINKTFSNPTYIFPGAYTFSISSNSYIPLAQDANGALVGYSRVEVMDIDLLKNTNGKTVYFYRNTPSTPGSTEAGFPVLPFEDNGLEDNIEIWNSKNERVMQTIKTYDLIEEKHNFGVSIVDNYIGPDVCAASPFNAYCFQGRWNVNYYPLQTRWFALSSSTEYLYSPSATSVSNQKQINYNNLGQTISESNLKSDGNKFTINSLYPNDVNNPSVLVKSMKTKCLYNLLLNQKQLKNDISEIWNKEWVYNPTSTSNIKVTAFNQSNLGAGPYTVVSDVLYDAKDNVIQAKSNEIFTTYLWSYNYQYLIAEIKNATFDEVTKELGGSTIDQLSASLIPDMSKVDALRQNSNLSKAQITTYCYKPLIGISSVTDAKGVIINYNYDDFGKLNSVLDNGNNIIKQVKYNYRNPPIFYNTEQSGEFNRNNCGPGYTTSPVPFIVDANQYSSNVSVEDANLKAQNYLKSKGQDNANTIGICSAIYYNDIKSQTFIKNNCQSGYIGSNIIYTVPSNTYSSTVSKVDANQKAQNDINSNGQNYANSNGNCILIYYNDFKSQIFTKTNCVTGYSGNKVTYSVPANTYSSIVSKADANQQAQNDININGQNYTNTNINCTCYQIQGAIMAYSGFVNNDNDNNNVLTNDGVICTFKMSFYPTHTISMNTPTKVGYVSAGFRPSVKQTFNGQYINNRIYTIDIDPNGDIYWTIIQGSNLDPGTNNIVTTTTLTYKL